MKPLVVKLAMIVMLTLNTRRQRKNTRMLRAPRMRRERQAVGASRYSLSRKSLVSEQRMISVPPYHEYEDNT